MHLNCLFKEYFLCFSLCHVSFADSPDDMPDYPLFISIGDWLDSIKMSQYKNNFLAAGYTTLDSISIMSIEWAEPNYTESSYTIKTYTKRKLSCIKQAGNIDTVKKHDSTIEFCPVLCSCFLNILFFMLCVPAGLTTARSRNLNYNTVLKVLNLLGKQEIGIGNYWNM